MKGSINVHKREMFVIDVSLFLLGHVIVAVDNNRKHKSDAARSWFVFVSLCNSFKSDLDFILSQNGLHISR